MSKNVEGSTREDKNYKTGKHLRKTTSVSRENIETVKKEHGIIGTEPWE